MTMKRKTLARLLHNELGYKNAESVGLVDTVLEIIAETLERRKDVLISGFGKFSVNEKRERLGRNPHTAEKIMVSARRVVRFKTSRNLRKALNGGDVFP